jgi:hypothetical protein
MKKHVSMTIIFLTLLVSSIGIAQSPSQIGQISESSNGILSAGGAPERVYGKDVSYDIWSDISEASYRNHVRKVAENGS